MTGGYVKTKNEKKYFPLMKYFLTCTPKYHVVNEVIESFLEILDLGFTPVSSLSVALAVFVAARHKLIQIGPQ